MRTTTLMVMIVYEEAGGGDGGTSCRVRMSLLMGSEIWSC